MLWRAEKSCRHGDTLATDYKELTCAQIDAARTKAGQYIDVFRHCQKCRADAIGIKIQSIQPLVDAIKDRLHVEWETKEIVKALRETNDFVRLYKLKKNVEGED